MVGGGKGACAYTPDKKGLACRPDAGMRPVPQFAIDGCKGKAAGDACTAGRGEGACAYTPDGKTLACKPEVSGRPGAR
ncbi:MAG: hypothetical protein CSYNP_04522 [Syntrophus sp. SKADARSKE-3]|nr:hypothetical protein [Syntrophus sp. SKADARSKE-3]